MTSGSSRTIRTLGLGAITAATGTALLLTGLQPLRQLAGTNPPQLPEALYLPNERAIEVVSFGYRKALASFLWFRTINYFGKHYASDQHYEWLFLMCDLVTTLDPQALHVYEFGSNILAWEANSPEDARRLLTKGMQHNPSRWKLPYLRGFISLYFLNQEAEAREDFVTASHLPDVHPIVIGLAAKTVALQNDPEQALAFLKNVLSSNDDPHVRTVLMQKVRDLSYERDLLRLEAALLRYREAKQSLPSDITELAPYLDRPVSLEDPFGGHYVIDSASETVRSTSNRKRLGRNK